MPKSLRLYHDEHFDLLKPEDAPQGLSSLGTYEVLNRGGEAEQRGKYLIDAPGNTTDVELPADYDSNDLPAVMHLVQTLSDRHSGAATSVSGSDPALTAKVAVLLGVPVHETQETSA